MDALVQTIVNECETFMDSLQFLQLVPRFVKEAENLLVPGAEKKATVLKTLHMLVDALFEYKKISDELAKELHECVDSTVSVTVNMLIDASKGSLRMPQTVEEVAEHVNCCIGVVQLIVGIVKASKTKPSVQESNTVQESKTEVAQEV